jgi:CO/xanthine dehydrogenase Mo-binding subunit
VKIRRFVAIDDAATSSTHDRPGQVHGGLTMGLAPALFEEISYDDNGNVQGGSFIDYLLPTAVETPKWETGHTIRRRPTIRSAPRASAVGHRRRPGDCQRGGGRALASRRAASTSIRRPRCRLLGRTA